MSDDDIVYYVVIIIGAVGFSIIMIVMNFEVISNLFTTYYDFFIGLWDFNEWWDWVIFIIVIIVCCVCRFVLERND